VNALQLGGAITMLVGVATFTRFDPLRLRQTTPVINV